MQPLLHQILTDNPSSTEAIEKFRQIIIHPPIAAEPAPPTDDDRSLSDQVVTKAESEIITSRNNKEHHDIIVETDFAKADHQSSESCYRSDLATSVDSQSLLCNTLVNVSPDQKESLSSATRSESLDSEERATNSSSEKAKDSWKSKAGAVLKTSAVAVGAIAASPILLPALGASALAAKVKGAKKGTEGAKFSAEEERALDLASEDFEEIKTDFTPVESEGQSEKTEVQTPAPAASKDRPDIAEDTQGFTPLKEGFAPVERKVSEFSSETPSTPTTTPGYETAPSESDLNVYPKEIPSESSSLQQYSDLTPVSPENEPDWAPALNQGDSNLPSEDQVDFVRTVDPIEEEPFAPLTNPNPTKNTPVGDLTPLATDQPTKSTTPLVTDQPTKSTPEQLTEVAPEKESAPVTESVTVIEKGYTFEDLVQPENNQKSELESQTFKSDCQISQEEDTPVSIKSTPPESIQVQKEEPKHQEFAPTDQKVPPVLEESKTSITPDEIEKGSVLKTGAKQPSSAPEKLESEKSIWDKAAEIDDVPSSFEAEETEDLTPSPTQQKINDQPISKVGVNSQELSKAVEIEQPTEQKEEEEENQVSSSSQRLDYKVTKEEETRVESANFGKDSEKENSEISQEAQEYENACLIKHSVDTESFQAETTETTSDWKSKAGTVLKTGALAVGAVAGAAFVLPALGASAVAGSIASAGAGAASVSATGFATATAAAASTAAATAVAVKSATSGGSAPEEETETLDDDVKGQENRITDNKPISSLES